jgi:hypothetical protein
VPRRLGRRWRAATSAARAGVPEARIMAQTGHRSLPVLRGYTKGH